MSKIAIIGGDSRVLQVDWGSDFKAFTGDDSGRLVKAAREGTVRGVIALSKWMHNQLKNGLRSLPANLRVVYWPGSINSLERELDDLVERNFPEPVAPAPPPPATKPPEVRAPFNPVIPAAAAPKLEAVTKPPVYVEISGEPMSATNLLKVQNGLSKVQGGIALWTKEEQEMLLVARAAAEDELRKNGKGDGAYIKGVGQLTRKLFLELGGNPARTVESLGSRYLRIAAYEQEKREAAERSERAKRGAATRTANRQAPIALMPRPAMPAMEVPTLPGVPFSENMQSYTNGAPEVIPIRAVPAEAPKQNNQALVRILRHVREGVELGLRTKEQGFDDICAQLDRLLATEE